MGFRFRTRSCTVWSNGSFAPRSASAAPSWARGSGRAGSRRGFSRDAAVLTGRIEPVDDELFGASIHLEDDVESAAAGLDDAIAAYAGEADPTYTSLATLVDRMRDDARLHRVEQVMQLSPWSARTTQRVFRRYVGVPVKWVLVPVPAAAGSVGDREPPGSRLRRPGGPPRLVRPGAFHQRLPCRCWAARQANTPTSTAASGGRLRCREWTPPTSPSPAPRNRRRLLAAGTISAPALLDLYLDRISRLDPRPARLPRRAGRLRAAGGGRGAGPARRG